MASDHGRGFAEVCKAGARMLTLEDCERIKLRGLEVMEAAFAHLRRKRKAGKA